ncbi:MAG: hypothetical protein MHMPM18_004508 [Marteilia pararefringens]
MACHYKMNVEEIFTLLGIVFGSLAIFSEACNWYYVHGLLDIYSLIIFIIATFINAFLLVGYVTYCVTFLYGKINLLDGRKNLKRGVLISTAISNVLLVSLMTILYIINPEIFMISFDGQNVSEIQICTMMNVLSLMCLFLVLMLNICVLVGVRSSRSIQIKQNLEGIHNEVKSTI